MPAAQPLQNGDPESLGGYRLVGRVGQGGGIVLGQRMGGSENEANGGSGGGSNGDSGDASGDGSGDAAEDTSGDDFGNDSSDVQSQAIPEFIEDYDGDWEGLVEDGTLYTMEIEEGERTTTLVDDENSDCFYELALVESTEDGYAGTFEDPIGMCQISMMSGDFQLGLVDGFLLVDLSDDDGNDLQAQLQPAD